MKAHRFKTRLITANEMRDRFYSELNPRITKRINSECIGKGIIVTAKYLVTEECVKSTTDEKLKLINEWETKGINMAFLKEDQSMDFMNLLELKHFGKPLNYKP